MKIIFSKKINKLFNLVKSSSIQQNITIYSMPKTFKIKTNEINISRKITKNVANVKGKSPICEIVNEIKTNPLFNKMRRIVE